jgi:predicted TIM-barrel fold metal-dependent hydrolase
LHPARLEDTDPALWDPVARTRRLDEYGIAAQVIYPNVALFGTKSLVNMMDAELQLACVRAYNDFQSDYSDAGSKRFIPMTILPFWDLDATLKEMERCAEKGHRGIVFSQEPAWFGLPALANRHWDPLWAAAQEMKLPVNFHIAISDMSVMDGVDPRNGASANFASVGAGVFTSNAKTISQLVFSGICHRFPSLKFVSVESGIGWIPTALEMMDWQWKNCGVAKEHPEYDLLPSEYFRRQIYGCFWMEKDSARSAIDQLGHTNFLFETDFPHPTCMSPGPASTGVTPREYVSQTFGDYPESTLRRLMHDNAAELYNIPAAIAGV